MRDELAADLIRDEGVVLHAYQDHLGFWTIGCGRLIDQRRGGGITHDEAMMLLQHDIDRVCAELDEAIPWWISHSDNRRRVLASMAFQLGVAGLLSFRNTLAAVRRQDYEAAAEGMLRSRWATQTPVRARRLADLMRAG